MRTKLLTLSLIFLLLALASDIVASGGSAVAVGAGADGYIISYGDKEYVVISWSSPSGESFNAVVDPVATGSRAADMVAAWNVYRDGSLVATGVAHATFKVTVTYSGRYVKVTKVTLYARSVDAESGNVKWSTSKTVDESITLSGSSTTKSYTVASNVYISTLLNGAMTIYLEVRVVVTAVGLKSGKTLTLDSGWIRLGKYEFEWSESAPSNNTGLYSISWVGANTVKNVFLVLAATTLLLAAAVRR